MRWSISRRGFLLALGAVGCAAPDGSNKPDAALADYVLRNVPSDLQNPTLVDFGGAVHLVGWDLEPKDLAVPGSTLKLKLYWRSVKKLSDGWSLFTHLIVPNQEKPYSFDDVGPLRTKADGKKQKLSPSDWVPGSVYIDEQSLKVPEDLEVPEVTLAVGLYREALQVVGQELDGLTGLRLPILSGLSDGKNRAIVARLATGVNSAQRKAKERKSKSNERRPGHAERPRNPRDPARPGARPEPKDPKETP